MFDNLVDYTRELRVQKIVLNAKLYQTRVLSI